MRDIMTGRKDPTVIHLLLNATSRTVLSGNVAAIFMYFKILGSSAKLHVQNKL